MTQGFSALLSANPRLECLSLDIRSEAHGYPASISLASLQVRLPFLRSFSLGNGVDAKWALQILQVTDAPALEYFKLAISAPYLNEGEVPGKVFRYLGKGRLNGDLQCKVPPKQPTSNYSSIFPSLRHLNIEDMSGHYSSILPVLEAFPSVTRVTLDRGGLDALYKRPELIPNAAHFTYNARYTGSTTDALRQVALRRVDAGLRIPFLEVIPSARGKHLLAQIESETERERIPPLRRLVDKIEVREQEPNNVSNPDSDDDQLWDDSTESDGEDTDETDDEE